MATSITFDFNRILSHAFRDEERIDRTLFKRFSNHHFSVCRPRLSLDQFSKEPIHDLSLSIQFDFTHQGPSVIDQLSNTRFVGITNIEMRLSNLLCNLMMEVFVSNDVIFGCARPADNDGLNVLKVRKPVLTGMFCGSLEEVVSRFLNQPLETLGRLTTLSVLTHNVGYQMLLYVNTLP